MSNYYKTKKKTSIVSKSGIGQRADNRFLAPNSLITLHKRNFLGLQKKMDYKISIVNLSIKGLQVLTTEPLIPGDQYNVTLSILRFPDPMTMRAKVIWSNLFKKEINENYYRAGFKFIKLSEEIKDNLIQLDSDV